MPGFRDRWCYVWYCHYGDGLVVFASCPNRECAVRVSAPPLWSNSCDVVEGRSQIISINWHKFLSTWVYLLGMCNLTNVLNTPVTKFSSIVAIAMVALVSLVVHATCGNKQPILFQYQVQDGNIGQFYSALPGSLLAKSQYVTCSLCKH